MYKRNLREEKYVENISNAARTHPTALDCVMKEQLQFGIRVLNAVYPIRLPHRSSVAGARLVSRLTTASRRTERGLDTSLSPRPISPPCGGCASVALGETSMPKTKTQTAEVMVEAEMGSLFRLRCVRRNG